VSSATCSLNSIDQSGHLVTALSTLAVALGCVERVASRQRRGVAGAERAQQVERVPAARGPPGRTQRRRVVDVPAPRTVTRRQTLVPSRLQSFRAAVRAAGLCKPDTVTHRDDQHGCECILPGYCTPTQCQSHCRAGLFVTDSLVTPVGYTSCMPASSLAASIAHWRDQTVCDK